ncbi:hypothetical protein FOL47_006897 [Perkinsus chesapeaki]|uniref:Uncharacterized protein n=1 Tax=Perkinsus chesapeaki TaxID=330153 RepID=A0A7J6LP83_PERCH|nr:hypothetical protein FOL47_006897 [Perkinsus chesapeaki]
MSSTVPARGASKSRKAKVKVRIVDDIPDLVVRRSRHNKRIADRSTPAAPGSGGAIELPLDPSAIHGKRSGERIAGRITPGPIGVVIERVQKIRLLIGVKIRFPDNSNVKGGGAPIEPLSDTARPIWSSISSTAKKAYDGFQEVMDIQTGQPHHPHTARGDGGRIPTHHSGQQGRQGRPKVQMTKEAVKVENEVEHQDANEIYNGERTEPSGPNSCEVLCDDTPGEALRSAAITVKFTYKEEVCNVEEITIARNHTERLQSDAYL